MTVRWVGVSKGDDENPNYRSRLVAREIRRTGEDPTFAPTPPLESLRAILSLASATIKGVVEHVYDHESPQRTQINFRDIARAYFGAKTGPEHPSHVELPAEEPGHKEYTQWEVTSPYVWHSSRGGWLA